MPDDKVTNDITPVLAKDVSFNDKIQTVDTALTQRTEATREIKSAWAKILQVLAKSDDRTLPARRPGLDTIVRYPHEVIKYKPQPEILSRKDLKELDQAGNYELRSITNKARIIELLDKKFSGIATLFSDYNAYARAATAASEVDEDATTKLRTEMQSAVDVFMKAQEKYDDTVENVKNVKEYVGIIKDVAEISAISQGNQLNK